MTYHQSYWIFNIGMLVSIALMGISVLCEAYVLGCVGLILLLAAAGQTRFFHRCPKCGSYVRPMMPEYGYCPHCGEKLE